MTLDQVIEETFKEDLANQGDHTSLSCIPEGRSGSAKLVAKEPGVIAGVELAVRIFRHLDQDLKVDVRISDGDEIAVGDVILTVEGSARSILIAERTMLNFMQRMSGIATKTRMLVNLISGTNAKLLDTRKTTPLLREIEKWAVRIGGGHNHRMGLYDMVMIKDNHADMCGGISSAVSRVTEYKQSNSLNIPVEVEVRDLQQLKEVLSLDGVDRVMLDNFTPELMKEAIGMVNGKIETEASGNITEQTVASYAATGVDFISVGALTHHIKSLDLSLKADLNV